MHGCSISTIILPFKILFQYGLVNTDIVTPPFSPWHKTISTVSYRPRLVPNLCRRQTCAPAKAIKAPARPSMVCLYREGYQYKQQKMKKFIKKMQRDSRSKGAKSHTDMLLKGSLSFLEITPSLCRRALQFKGVHWGAVPCASYQIAYVCRLLRYRISIAVSTLGCLKMLTVHLSRFNNTQNYCLNVSITWRLQHTDYSGREQSAPERTFIVYWSVLSLWEGLMGAWGSLIKLTLRVTHGAEAAEPQHLDATMNTFSSSVPLSAFSQAAREPQEMTRL